jgi:hypothetical protein
MSYEKIRLPALVLGRNPSGQFIPGPSGIPLLRIGLVRCYPQHGMRDSVQRILAAFKLPVFGKMPPLQLGEIQG